MYQSKRHNRFHGTHDEEKGGVFRTSTEPFKQSFRLRGDDFGPIDAFNCVATTLGTDLMLE